MTAGYYALPKEVVNMIMNSYLCIIAKLTTGQRSVQMRAD
jgi:hypothetical protein